MRERENSREGGGGGREGLESVWREKTGMKRNGNGMSERERGKKNQT